MKELLAGSAAVATVALVATSALWLAVAASPPSVAAPAGLVQFAGCVKPGVEAGCLIVESEGKTYDVTSAQAKLKIGDFASGTGMPGGISTCMKTPNGVTEMQGEDLMKGDAMLTGIILDPEPPKHAPCA